MGTNKGASVWGTAWATGQYLQRVQLDWRALAPAAVLSLAGSFLGAWLLTLTSPDGLRGPLPWLLTGCWSTPWPCRTSGGPMCRALQAGLSSWPWPALPAWWAFYDGFFGPGTGSFFVFLFVRVLGYDFRMPRPLPS